MSFVTSLCLRFLSSMPGWEPSLSSGGAGAELQHSDGVAGREGGYCGRHQEEMRSSSCSDSSFGDFLEKFRNISLLELKRSLFY